MYHTFLTFNSCSYESYQLFIYVDIDIHVDVDVDEDVYEGLNVDRCRCRCRCKRIHLRQKAAGGSMAEWLGHRA